MSLPEWLHITAEFRGLWERCDRLNPEEWMRLDSLFAAIQPSRSFQRTPLDRRQRLLDLWARRESLTVRETSQLDRGIRLLVQDIELQEWWSHRDALSDPGWTQFYRLIFQTLRANWGKFGALLKSLPESLDFYIHDFFPEKSLNRVEEKMRESAPSFTPERFASIFTIIFWTAWIRSNGMGCRRRNRQRVRNLPSSTSSRICSRKTCIQPGTT